ncbi:M48 family metalloprotease [Altererythrobacter xixiisoli]|uniref:M48 family metalloprotease n=1 Tax=Croceibacterium xixiisoli TaxID=1476466 RepID=A0A6I4TQ22_9SPHN|nr:M48 family metallopeptidase [Croceibacterium xixiisoli]MXO98042.1 M48 family metalloprotease [Croceibacterium xixiisoli]
MRPLRHLVAAGLCLAAPSVASAAEDFTIPSWTGAYQPQGEDERGLWRESDEIERAMVDSELVIRDPALNAFVRGVLCRIIGDVRCNSVRLYVTRSPSFNASMYANGMMLVNSGLLLRMRNEAELASVLGHEFAHFEQRHTLQGFKNRRAGSDLAAWAAVVGALAISLGSTNATYQYTDLRLNIYGGIARFERKQETDANVLGFAYMAHAGYRPSAASDVWRAVMNEADQSAEGRKRRSGRYDNVAFFASHPTNLQRADYLSQLANRVPGGDFDGAANYRAALAPWRQTFLEDQLKLNDFGGTDYIITRLAGGEQLTPDLLYARAELYRGRGHPRDLQNAIPLYREAIEKDPALVAAWRGLGLSLLRTGQMPEGKAALSTFLEHQPDTGDAPMLRSLIGA